MFGRLKYAAACVRVCAMQTHLLGADDWQRLLQMAHLQEMVTWLAQRGLVPSAAQDIPEAQRTLREGVIEDSEKLIRFVSGPAEAMLAFFIYHYDLLNLETVIGRLHAGAGGAAPAHLYETGRFGLLSREALSTVTSYGVLTDMLLGTPFAGPFASALAHYQEDGDLPALLTSMEYSFLADWQTAVARCLTWRRRRRSTFDLFVAARAMTWAIRLKFFRKRQDYEVHRCLDALIRRADVKACYTAMEATIPETAFRLLAAALLPEGVPARLADAPFDLDLLDIRLMGVILEEANRRHRPIDFSAEYLIGYHFLKLFETENLVRLLEGKALGVDGETMQKYLVGVA